MAFDLASLSAAVCEACGALPHERVELELDLGALESVSGLPDAVDPEARDRLAGGVSADRRAESSLGDVVRNQRADFLRSLLGQSTEAAVAGDTGALSGGTFFAAASGVAPAVVVTAAALRIRGRLADLGVVAALTVWRVCPLPGAWARALPSRYWGWWCPVRYEEGSWGRAVRASVGDRGRCP